MLSIKNYINDILFETKVSEELANTYQNEILINESFQSSLLSKLADKIKTVEKDRPKDNREIQDPDNYNYRKYKNYNSFSSLFKPRFVGKTSYNKILIGIKWDEVTDSQFKLYKVGEKKFKTLCNKMMGEDVNVLIITCKPDTQDIVAFVNGYGSGIYNDSDYSNSTNVSNAVLYSFNKKVIVGWGENAKQGKRTAPVMTQKGKYGSRPVRGGEIYALIKDFDNYVLDITNDMLVTYGMSKAEREEMQKGQINFDKESLDKILKDQQARYKALAKEMKAKKLRDNEKDLLDQISKIQPELIKLGEEIINKQKYDLTSEISTLMCKCANAFEYYYRYIRNKADEKRERQHYEKSGKEWDRKYSFYAGYADENIRDVQDTINRINQEIEKIKQQL